MSTFLVRRLILLVVVLFGISLITFFISHILPGDPARLALGSWASPEAVQQFRAEMGLDRPLPEQYGHYLAGLLHGDFGESMFTRRPVRTDLAEFLPASLELTVAAFFLCVVVGYPLGILAARYHGRGPDRAVNSVSVLGVAVPVFWIGIIFQLVFYNWLGWLPAEGSLPMGMNPPPVITHSIILDSILTGNWDILVNALRHLILPAVTLALPSTSYVIKLVRCSILETMGSDYVRTARGKGLGETRVLLRHALPNALLAAVTVTGMLAGNMLAGAFLVEIVFNRPGIGWYTYKTILAQDFSAVITVTLIIALVYMLTNLVVNLLYVALDPRIRYK